MYALVIPGHRQRWSLPCLYLPLCNLFAVRSETFVLLKVICSFKPLNGKLDTTL